jgi:hypothetical protein
MGGAGTAWRAINSALAALAVLSTATMSAAQQTEDDTTRLPGIVVSAKKQKGSSRQAPGQAPATEDQETAPFPAAADPQGDAAAQRQAQELPGSATVLTRKMLDDAGIDTIQDLGRQSPNVLL